MIGQLFSWVKSNKIELLGFFILGVWSVFCFNFFILSQPFSIELEIYRFVVFCAGICAFFGISRLMYLSCFSPWDIRLESNICFWALVVERPPSHKK
jgi:hypothetical protein